MGKKKEIRRGRVPPGFKKFWVEFKREMTQVAGTWVLAQSEEEIRKSDEIQDRLREELCNWEDDWEHEPEFSRAVEEKSKYDSDLYQFVLNDELYDFEEEFIDKLREQVRKEKQKPLPGQLGIPGVGKDVPA